MASAASREGYGIHFWSTVLFELEDIKLYPGWKPLLHFGADFTAWSKHSKWNIIYFFIYCLLSEENAPQWRDSCGWGQSAGSLQKKSSHFRKKEPVCLFCVMYAPWFWVRSSVGIHHLTSTDPSPFYNLALMFCAGHLKSAWQGRRMCRLDEQSCAGDLGRYPGCSPCPEETTKINVYYFFKLIPWRSLWKSGVIDWSSAYGDICSKVAHINQSRKGGFKNIK